MSDRRLQYHHLQCFSNTSKGTIAENFADVEVYDEHPDFYLGGGDHQAANGNDFGVYHLENAATNNYDHLVSIYYV